MRMLLRLLFWIVGAMAVLAWLWPGALALAAAGAPAAAVLLALAAWRAVVRRAALASAPLPKADPSQALGAAQLDELARALERCVLASTSLDAGLHAAAALLRSELGARCTEVHRVHAVDADAVRLGELLPAHPLWHSPQRSVRVDAEPAAAAALHGRCVGDATRGWAVPVRGPDGVVAVLCLKDLAIPVPATALQVVLERAAGCLSQLARAVPARGLRRAAGGAGGPRIVRSVTARPRRWSAARDARRCGRECARQAACPAPLGPPGSQQGVLAPALAGGVGVGDNDSAPRRRCGRVGGGSA